MNNNQCTICRRDETVSLLNLKNADIYQHPVPKDAAIPPPYKIDIDFYFCRDCGHAYQHNYDVDLLSSIYSNYYYTPAQDGIGRQFRDDFIDFVKANVPEMSKALNVLEIGSSSGELLMTSLEAWPHIKVLGFEPSNNSADIALSRNIPTIKDFFSSRSTRSTGNFDIIFSRHVIEHIDDQHDFWLSINNSSYNHTVLVIETPSLDRVLNEHSLDPFHIEHLHVFSVHSLSYLAKSHGWFLRSYTATDSNKLITCYIKDNTHCIETTPPSLDHSLNDTLVQIKHNLMSHIKGKQYWLWGAGSYGVKMLSFYGLTPERVLDGNRNKSGKVMVGYPWLIEHGPDVISTYSADTAITAPTIIIASSFYKEIMADIARIGWKGEILTPSDWEPSHDN